MRLRVMMVLLSLVAMPLAASDLSRLQAILLDAQNDKVTISSVAWKVSGNEAVTLANRIKGGQAATNMRTHVRQMRDAAAKGDAASARDHASQALAFANQLEK
jgi:hypothetical protein